MKFAIQIQLSPQIKVRLLKLKSKSKLNDTKIGSDQIEIKSYSNYYSFSFTAYSISLIFSVAMLISFIPYLVHLMLILMGRE